MHFGEIVEHEIVIAHHRLAAALEPHPEACPAAHEHPDMRLHECGGKTKGPRLARGLKGARARGENVESLIG